MEKGAAGRQLDCSATESREERHDPHIPVLFARTQDRANLYPAVIMQEWNIWGRVYFITRSLQKRELRCTDILIISRYVRYR